ncbi:auxin-induced protein 22D-like [Silene latifolia]|uniref:auxin-induced protein 22D-like n=1 Tax=Silene latifolia TaxID=37657 RepID=UPI003D776CF0
MELELGLSLSNCTFHKIQSLKELDLIGCYVNYEGNNQDYYGDNLSSLSSCEKSSSVNEGDYEQEIRNYDNGLCRKKRKFDEVEKSEFCKGETLPLLLWDKHPNEDDSDHKRLCTSTSFTISKNESDEVVGWPPINTYRRKQHDTHPQQHHHNRRRGNCQAVENGGGGCGRGPRSLYVKAQMQGCLIKRKIDLKLYHCYETLTSSLLQMFGKDQDRVDDYKLTYQDEEGDWLLAGDVPWRTFTQSVRRLKMVRRDD